MGVLSIGADGQAFFFEGSGESGARMLASMERVKIDFAGVNGIQLSGFQHIGNDKRGRRQFRFQEWWLSYKDFVDVPDQRKTA